ncbi:MAG: zinc-binding dehydrogenase [Acidimicrobiales bacterium]|nr:zinc-binding dehydrogenase [Acidimicrobiales bacterium]MDP6298096.1 zinc-binding dehydrogenase [Acidimicrobiales bacterium]HJM29382.1 zinc-binding dehydrogenase [Acidimicrobiales bacterium]HJM96826.1 zinc-binding dehydrogenase [Acidimicrobiales bacterium]
MKAVKVRNSRIEVCDVPNPSGDGILVSVKSVGICGSDLHLIDTGMMNVTPGHEIAGVAPNGKEVAVEPMLSCGECLECLRGSQPYCEIALPNTMGIGIDGGMAEKIVVPERLLVPLHSSVNVKTAFLIEPLAVAVRSLLRVGAKQASRIIVVGGGTIGLCCVAVAKHFGAEVELEARHPHQLEAGYKLGATPRKEEPASIVVEAAGTNSALLQAVNLCEKGGAVAIPSTYWDPVQLPGMEMGMREISLIPSITYGHTDGGRDFELAAKILTSMPEISEALISHRFPLDAAVEAFDVARSRSEGAIKVAIDI